MYCNPSMRTIPRNIITIGYAKRTLEPDSRERRRMQSYAARFDAYHVIVFTRASEGLVRHAEIGNLHVHGTHARTRIGMLFAAIRIGRRIIKGSQGKWIVSSQDPFETSLVGRAVAFGDRALHHVQLHGDLFNPVSHGRSLLGFLRIRFGLFVVRTAKCIRVVSHRIERSLIAKGVDRDRISVVPIQADIGAFLHIGESRSYDVRRPLRFLYVGRFSPEKNIPLVLEAFAAVSETYPDARLSLLGAGPLREKIETDIRIKNLSHAVELLPWSDDVPTIMREHDVLCLASDHEGWAMVLVEAAAAGMAVITTDVGCAGEFIEHGAHGQVVPVADAERFTEAMLDYLVNPTHVETHGRNAFLAAQRFSLTEEQYTDRIVESFASCSS